MSATHAAQAATVTGVVTYLYNDFVGHRGDEGARAILIPLPVPPKYRVTVAKATAAGELAFNSIPRSQTEEVDGYGNVEFDDVRPGSYVVLLISSAVKRDTSAPLEMDFLNPLRPVFASDAGFQAILGEPFSIESPPPASEMSAFRLFAAVAMPLTVRGDRAHFSWDFGVTYI